MRNSSWSSSPLTTVGLVPSHSPPAAAHSPHSQSQWEVIADLQKKVALERSVNQDAVLNCSAETSLKSLSYGDKIQLLHVRTNRFLSVERRNAAHLAKGARKVVLMDHGDEEGVAGFDGSRLLTLGIVKTQKSCTAQCVTREHVCV